MQGLDRHGIKYDTGRNRSGKHYDLSVNYGHQKIPKNCTDYLIEENAYYNNKKALRSYGFNGLNGEADFVNENSDGLRWHDDNLIKPYDYDKDGYVLIIGQNPGDASLNSKYAERVLISDWMEEQERFYLKKGVKVVVRKHPKVYQNAVPLYRELDGAKLVVTCSSTVGVDAIMYGKPTIAMHPCSMVYKLCKDTTTPDRTQWVKDLSYCQWTREEISNGDTWDHLKKKYE